MSDRPTFAQRIAGALLLVCAVVLTILAYVPFALAVCR